MKLFAPKYYKDFKCLADKCRHSCCVGWEIDVDETTMKKYSSISGGYGEKIKKSIDKSETPHFKLGSDERCPHLDENGLCRIITELGEGYLCDICREHPRFYNDTPYGKDVGLGMACEEACRIILNSDDYAEIIEIGEVNGALKSIDFDVLTHRKKIYDILSDAELSYAEKLHMLCGEYRISPTFPSEREWRTLIDSLEYLDDGHRELFLCYSSNPKTPKSLEKPLERALAYFIYRHCSAAENEDDLRASLGLCLFLERMLASSAEFAEIQTAGEMNELARVISEEIEYSVDNTETIKQEFLFC